MSAASTDGAIERVQLRLVKDCYNIIDLEIFMLSIKFLPHLIFVGN